MKAGYRDRIFKKRRDGLFRSIVYFDCVLAGYHFTEGTDILTFDRKLNILINPPQ